MADDEFFTSAPEVVIRYFDGKSRKPTFHWRDIASHEHAVQFTVAKTAGYDVLDDLHKATREAIANQQPFEQFTANLENTLKQKGWWGRKNVIDPITGDKISAQLGSPRRLRTIYWANTSTAHAAGEWQRTQRTKEYLPYIHYLFSLSAEPRDQHKQWYDIILPVDDAFWKTHYPPNGWGCECLVEQVTRLQADEMGYKGEPAPKITTRPWLDKRNGKTFDVPNGIDPGWDNNPGIARERNVARFLAQKIEQLPSNMQKAAITDLVGSPLFRKIAQNGFNYDAKDKYNPIRSIAAPIASLPQSMRDQLSTDSHVVMLTVADGEKILRKHPEVTLEYFEDLQKQLTSGDMFLEGSKLVVRLFHGSSHWIAIIKRTNKDELFLNSYFRTNQDYFERIKKKQQN